ncbi:DedA family protein [Arthrobacter cheniae]|uniref:DedA family protein n=1 Tax=Arthrobacter cheniae TaxID=1258888 RepID=A0A3A5M2V4_9MICC|nr:DedA family protein [Arthrobacter cheniae]RJT79896.1 DedA family protein [Arthrobacter cheniae]
MDLPGSDIPAPLYLLLMFAVIFVDVVIPIVPSELLVIGSGTMSAHGMLLLPLAIVTAFAGSWVGDVALFLLFRRRLTHFLDRFRWGRSIHRGLRNVIEKAGTSPTYAAVVAVRFLPGGRTASVAVAGIAELPLRPFMLAAAAGGLLWTAWLVGLGFIAGASTGLPAGVSALLGMAVGTLVGAITAAVLALKKLRKARKAHEYPDEPGTPAS